MYFSAAICFSVDLYKPKWKKIPLNSQASSCLMYYFLHTKFYNFCIKKLEIREISVTLF